MHNFYDPKIVQVQLQGDPTSEAPLHWKASLSTTRSCSPPEPPYCPQFGPQEMGESLSLWLLETGPAIQLELQVGPREDLPGLTNRLIIHAIGPTEGEAISRVTRAAQEVEYWLSLYTTETWLPCHPVVFREGMVSAYRAEPEPPDEEYSVLQGRAHHVGATARFLTLISSSKGDTLVLKVRATPSDAVLAEEFLQISRQLRMRQDNAATWMDHARSTRLIQRVDQLMAISRPQAFAVSLAYFTPESPGAIQRVLAQECMQEWICGTSWLEQATDVSRLDPEAQAPLALDLDTTAMLMKWMHGVTVEQQEEPVQDHQAAAKVLPF